MAGVRANCPHGAQPGLAVPCLRPHCPWVDQHHGAVSRSRHCQAGPQGEPALRPPPAAQRPRGSGSIRSIPARRGRVYSPHRGQIGTLCPGQAVPAPWPWPRRRSGHPVRRPGKEGSALRRRDVCDQREMYHLVAGNVSAFLTRRGWLRPKPACRRLQERLGPVGPPRSSGQTFRRRRRSLSF